MRVIYIVYLPYVSRRASSVQIVNTCRELARRGYSVDLVIPYDGGLTEEEILHFYGLERISKLNLVRVPPFPFRVSYWLGYAWFHLAASFKLLARHLSGEGGRVYYMRTDYEWPVLALLAPVARLIGVKIIAEAHCVVYPCLAEKGKLFRGAGDRSQLAVQLCRACEALIFRNVSGIVAVTGNLARMIKEEFRPGGPIIVCPNGVRLSSGTPRFGGERPGGRSIKLAYMGGLYKWKGLETAIRAMKHLPENVGLYLLGFGTSEKMEDVQERERDFLRATISALSLEDRVIPVEFVPPRDLPAALSAYHIGLIPLSDNIAARYFTSPLKLFEYMACGMPIVASNLPAIREILRDGENAVLVEPSDPIALADGVRKLLNNGKMAESIAVRAFSDVRAYTWEKRAERISRLVRTVTAGGRE